MKVRKLAVALALAGGLGSGVAHALGMGEGRILTNLNEPLRAEIELRRVDDVPQEQIRVSLASEDDFDRAGINKMHFLRQLDFELTRADDGQLVIEITTDSPVREPFLNFLVDVTWPSGRVLRQYAFLVDPPERRDEREATGPEAEAADTAQPQDPGIAAEPEPTPDEEPESEVYGPTGSTDRLWNIAGEHSPSGDLTRQQVMLAIQDLNPEAFVEGNINRLRQGHVLRLPSEEQARTRSANAAVQEVMAQNEAFEAATTPEQPVVDATEEEPEEDLAAEPAPEATGEAEDDELRIMAAEGDADAGALAGNGVGNGNGELAATLEELDRVERERDEMSGRVDELEEQVETMEQLLELKDDQLAEMQQRMDEIEEREAELAEREARSEDEEEDTADVAAAPEPDEPAPAEEPVDPEPTVDEEPMPTTVGGFVERMVNDTRYQIGAGALALVLLALLWALARRNAAREEAFYDQIRDVSSDEEGDDLLDFGDEEAATEGDAAAGAGEDQPTDDVLAEADVYMAYGRTDQASQHLEEAISREPSRSDLRLKLLEAYAQSGDTESFEKQYRELGALGDDAAVQKADSLRETLGGGDSDLSIDDLADELKTGTGAEDESSDEFSFEDDFLSGSVSEEEAAETTDSDSGEEDLGIEWDLGDTSDFSESDETETADTAEDSSDDNADVSDLGFSLDDLELEDDAPAETGSEDDTELAEPELTEEDLASLDLGEDDQQADQADESLEAEEPLLDTEGFDEPEAPSTGEATEGPHEAIEFEAPEQTADSSEESAAEEVPEVASAEDTAAAAEASEFDESFLDELDAELDKVTGEEQEASTEQEEPAKPESLDDLELDVSDDDLALMDEAASETDAPEEPSQAAQSEDDEVLDLEPGESEDIGAISDEESRALQDDTLSSEEAEPASETDSAEEDALSSEQDSGGDSDFGELEDTDLDDSILEQAEAAVAGDSGNTEGDDTANPDDDEFDFLEGTDEAGTKLDLARAYVEMGDADGARDILEEVAKEGSDNQQEEAQRLLKDL